MIGLTERPGKTWIEVEQAECTWAMAKIDQGYVRILVVTKKLRWALPHICGKEMAAQQESPTLWNTFNNTLLQYVQ